MDISEALKDLSPKEREEAFKILSEIKESGKSTTLDSIYAKDYNEIPVSIDEFIENPEYAGWYTGNGKNIYPYWREKLREIFSPTSNYSEIALTGSIRTGKTHIAVIGLAYCLYCLMCLKDPHEYYSIAKGGYIYFVFFNVTLTLSRGVAYTKFQSLLLNSPWFMKRGKVVGDKNLEYVPDMPIRFTVGSQVEHSLGRDTFCLTGDTVILTSKGEKRLDEIAGKFVRVFSSDSNGNLHLSPEVLIQKTKSVTGLIEIQLEDNTIIKCTPEHKLRLINGEYKEASKLSINDELDIVQSKSGIYKVENLLNHKCYIGKSDKDVYERLKCHKNCGHHSNSHLRNAIKKYGVDNFSFEVLEFCSIDKTNERERYWIEYYDSFKNGYNCTTGGEGEIGWHLSDEAKRKISEGNKGKIILQHQREAVSKAQRGKHLSEEQKEFLRNAFSGKNNPFYGKTHSVETRKKISIANSHISDKRRKELSDKMKERQLNNVWINNGLENKFIKKEALCQWLQKGFVRGKIVKNASKKGKIFIHKGALNKQIDPSDLDKYLKDGFVVGLYRKNRRNKNNENKKY